MCDAIWENPPQLHRVILKKITKLLLKLLPFPVFSVNFNNL